VQHIENAMLAHFLQLPSSSQLVHVLHCVHAILTVSDINLQISLLFVTIMKKLLQVVLLKTKAAISIATKLEVIKRTRSRDMSSDDDADDPRGALINATFTFLIKTLILILII
jgi:hypothetical protein